MPFLPHRAATVSVVGAPCDPSNEHDQQMFINRLLELQGLQVGAMAQGGKQLAKSLSNTVGCKGVLPCLISTPLHALVYLSDA
jgi:hypothetical protein